MSSRELRSQMINRRTGKKRKLLYDDLVESTTIPRKRQKTLYHCLTCEDNKLSQHFPDQNPSPDCTHLINTCKACLQTWVNIQIEQGFIVTNETDNTVFGLRCLECPATIQPATIQATATPETYQLFDTQQQARIAQATPDCFWCQNPRCDAGEVLEDTRTNVSRCRKCDFASCVPCRRPAHKGETCAEYQVRIQGRVDEEDRSLATIRLATKACPRCGIKVEKNGGCAQMRCKWIRLLLLWALLTFEAFVDRTGIGLLFVMDSGRVGC